MSKRIFGPPRRPRNPVARAARTPLYRQRVERDKKRHPAPPTRSDLDRDLDHVPDNGGEEAEKDADEAD